MSFTNRMAVIILWVPIIAIYLVDFLVWYSIFCSIVGGSIGLFSHIGEIQNTQQLRLRFPFFASALQFKLMPDNKTTNTKVTLVYKLRNALHRLKLRYGLGKLYKKIELSQVEATRFALLWNEMIITLRQENLVSYFEVVLMELSLNCWDIKVIRWLCWDIKVIRWLCVLLCNELLLALYLAVELENALDRWLWFRIFKNEYRRCVVIEAYDSIKYFLLEFVKYGIEEHSIVSNLFTCIDESIRFEKFTATYKTSVLPKIHEQLKSLVKLLLLPE